MVTFTKCRRLPSTPRVGYGLPAPQRRSVRPGRSWQRPWTHSAAGGVGGARQSGWMQALSRPSHRASSESRAVTGRARGAQALQQLGSRRVMAQSRSREHSGTGEPESAEGGRPDARSLATGSGAMDRGALEEASLATARPVVAAGWQAASAKSTAQRESLTACL